MCQNIWAIFYLLSLLPFLIYGQDWQQPYFKPSDVDGIMFTDPLGSRQPIRMDEELPIPIRLAIITYTGTKTPTIGRFTYGSSQHLKLSIEKQNNEWLLIINTRQDYENPVQRRYEFEIGIEGEESRIISLRTENIFDNDPAITYDGPCQAKELHSNYNTNCIFTIIDVDGLENNEITLEIRGKNKESELFEFRNRQQIDDYTLNYTLYVTKELRYEERALYNFETIAYDLVRNSGSILTIVNVEDLPSLDPIWVKPFATARFPEKQSQHFGVTAIDGDTGINKPICFKLAFHPDEDYSKFVSINSTTGNIKVEEINRDALKQEVFPFAVVAFKCDNETWSINGDAVIIVDDINDNYPEITAEPNIIRFHEAKELTLPLNKFMVNDIDLGRHATYTVELVSLNLDINHAQPFTVIPNTGYQESNFQITVLNAVQLDYEDDDWRSFSLKIVASEEDDRSRYREQEFRIELINWNDELPIFNATEFFISIEETVDANVILTMITATDRDIGDRVRHSIVGITDLDIIDVDGQISTKTKDTFDYERQKLVIVQIMATDTLQTYPDEKLNTAYAQLRINIIDINDETPDLRMPRVSPSLMENSKAGTIVTDGIVATDPDTTANLTFKIDWNLSYATKSGQEAPKETYENCFIIEADTTNRNKVLGKLIVNPDFNKDIDYEEYEVIYLLISVTDENQVVNEGTTDGILIVRIEDENDNAPEFILDTLNTERSVVEEALSGTIGTIYAIDRDGPKYNRIAYSMRPTLKTPSELLQIDKNNGVISVKDGAQIDCDDPKIFNLTYEIVLSDGYWETVGNIEIHVIDINNKYPYFREFDGTVELYENITNEDIIQTIITDDLDRDSPHNKIQYLINYNQFPNLMKFEIDTLSGVLRLRNDARLDRDRGEPKYDIVINVDDNYLGNGRTNSNNTKIQFILLDVNDNAPEMPLPDTFKPNISENARVDTVIGGEFYAPDIDDETTPNAQVEYTILSIVPGSDTAIPVPNPNGLFTIKTIDYKYGLIYVAHELKGFYGTWMVTIEAADRGHLWTTQMQLKSKETYAITVNPYNFYEPELINPSSAKSYRLSFDQEIDKPLKLSDNSLIEPFEAKDMDGGIFGMVRFEMVTVGGGNDSDYFKIVQLDDKKSQIRLKESIELERIYSINIRAIDGGGKYSNWVAVKFIFIDLKGEPFFEMESFKTDFTENSTGLLETRIIPEAQDPKNVGIDDPENLFKIFYFIDYTFLPSDAQYFQLNAETRILRLQAELDRESIDHHTIRVIATNNKDGPAADSKSRSMLMIEISVNDVNDNPPKFERDFYGAGITDKDQADKEILKVFATDPDLNDTIRYVILPKSFHAIGDHLNDVPEHGFVLDINTGVITLNFSVQTDMKGYFEFKIQALDEVDHTDECNVKIFIVAEVNRVTFVLSNPKAMVDNEREFLQKTLGQSYGFECNIDDISKADVAGEIQEAITNVRANFIENNEAVEATRIVSRSNDPLFLIQLKSKLLERSINLIDVPDDLILAIETTQIAQIILIALCTVLALLLIAVILTFIFKMRNLKRQLKALSTTDFGSQSSGLNREKAPVFAVEGANSVLYDTSDLVKSALDNDNDTISITSGSSDESDFLGIDNDPTFLASGKQNNLATIDGELHKNGLASAPQDSNFGVHRF